MIIPLIALLVAVGGFGSWLLFRTDAPAAAASTTATVTTQTLKDTVAASGTVAAARTADLSFEGSGTVTSIDVQPGDSVTKGQELATIDDDLLVAQQDAAESALSAARSTLSEDIDNGAGDAQVASDEAQVASAESALEEANDALSGAVLRATFAGRVTAVDLEVGDRVGTSNAGAGGSDTGDTSTGVTVVSGNRWIVEATVSSADVSKVKKGLQAEVSISGIDETVYGTVSEVGLVAETSSAGAAVFPVKIAITDRRTDLFAGTSADVSVVVSQRTGVLTVDARALKTDSDTGTTYVDKVVDAATGATERVDVEVGQSYGLSTEITKGLAEADVVQVPGFSGLPGGGNRQQGGGDTGFQGPPGGFVGVPGGGDGGPQIEFSK